MTRLTYLLLLILYCLPSAGQSQSVFVSDSLDAGNFIAQFKSNGQLFEKDSLMQGFEYPKQASLPAKRYSIFTSHLWMGGMDNNGALHVAAQTYRQSGVDFFYGPITDSASWTPQQDALWNRVWKVNQSDIDQFLLDHQNNAVNFSNYPVIQDWPAHGDPNIGQAQQLAPFVDVNNDNLYNPLDGDYPSILGDQAVFAIFNDERGSHGETGGDKLGVEIHAMAYVFDCPDSTFNEICFLNYRVINRSSNSYNDFAFGLWTDISVGYWNDDYLGCDTNRQTYFGYNGDANDETSLGYGLNPPSVGFYYHGAGLSKSMSYLNDFSIMGNPAAPDDYYEYLTGFWKDGSPWTAPGGGAPISHFYPGDPGWCGGGGNGGWTEGSGGNSPFDKRTLGAFQPIPLAPGMVAEYNIAVQTTRGFYNDNLGSVCEVLKLQGLADMWLDQGMTPCSQPNAVVPTEHTDFSISLFPNPAGDFVNISLPLASNREFGVKVVDLMGKELLESDKLKGKAVRMDIRDLPAGVYMVLVDVDGQGYWRKMVVER